MGKEKAFETRLEIALIVEINCISDLSLIEYAAI